jgi:predicted Zn-dependent protease
VQDRLALGNAAKDEAQAEKVAPKQLEAMLKKHPWNQWATLALANVDINAGKLDAAANRLRAIGKPTAMVRDTRQMLGQLASALGQLEEADELLSGLLGSRLARFAKVAAELEL